MPDKIASVTFPGIKRKYKIILVNTFNGYLIVSILLFCLAGSTQRFPVDL